MAIEHPSPTLRQEPEAVDDGVCVLVDGAVVAWFATFDDAAEDWCTCNHFGRWITWRGTTPEPIPLSPEQQAECERVGREIAGKLREHLGRAGG